MANRIIYIDFIKSIAMFLVLLLHSAAPLLYQIGKINDNIWAVGNAYDSFSRVSVPLFFMVSGVLLLKQENEAILALWKKIFYRFIIPLFIWSFIYLLYKIFILHQDINILHNMLLSIFRREYYHLWFIYAFIGIYIVLPILRLIIHRLSINYIITIIIIWFFNVSIFPTLQQLYNLKISIDIPFFNGYVGFLLVGYLLDKVNISKKILIIGLFVILLSTFTTYIGTSILSYQYHVFNPLLYSYFSFSTILAALGAFIVLKELGTKIQYNTKMNTLFRNISMTSFGIYLIHPIWLDVIKININNFTPVNVIYIIPLTATMALLFSFFTVKIIQNIPILRRILP